MAIATVASSVPMVFAQTESSDSILTSDIIEIDRENGYASGFATGTTAETLAGAFSGSNGGEVMIVDENGDALASNAIVGTGAQVQLVVDGTVVDELTLILYGDVNGDGNLTIVDLTTIKSQILGRTDLSGAYLTAANYNQDDRINVLDLLLSKLEILNSI